MPVETRPEDLREILPAYRSHKTVHAARIHEVTLSSRQLVIRLDDGSSRTVNVPDAFFSRYVPMIGDWLVVYGDGYLSASPSSAFETGYTRIDPR